MINEFLNIVIGLVAFLLFAFTQSLFINGVKNSMEEGMILEVFAKWAKKTLGEYWSKPVAGCIRCMASLYGAITYWPCVIIYFGVEWWQVPVFMCDVFVVVYINYFLYKRQ